MALWRLMACLAHPDDECFSMAGILASSTAQGVAVELICATRGEAGDIRMPGSATPASLGDVRHQELRASCNVLGIAEPIMLGYRDSGWGDDPAQRHPQAFVNAPDRDVVQQLVAEFRRFRPHVILTFEPGGLTGHKDHIAISKHATFAYQVAGDPHAFPEQLQDGLDAWLPQRLLYAARPQGSQLERARRLREAGVNVPLPPPETWSQGVPLEQIHLTLDVSEQLPTKLASLRCHRTQASPEMDHIDWSQGGLAEMYSTEYLIQADPPVPDGATIDADIFAGLNAE